ncbi:MAG: helix-turn-helix domain-containing protein [Phreatobacter sp.]|uniref:helix-turn-helix domain-containing protein n=1 Tax=Phreatobacter sp. TaxID=1966341 RepID=UPI00273725B6|nr:helix-turn-helix domain-containing protein [Phreatobacter sp.]MDP2804005.1 helix-turn-helix domain-containing protein [Phreatobacter sp.]
MARRGYRPGSVSIHRNYTVDEVSRAVGVSKITVRRWIADGLPVIKDQKPMLILGSELVAFFKRSKPKKQTCATHECFCFSCRCPRPPAFGAFEYRPMGKSGGNLQALCETCTTVMHKRVSHAALEGLKAEFTVTIMQADEHIGES